jgi:uncharacterized protein involved in exopolysaccharide biosynthesis
MSFQGSQIDASDMTASAPPGGMFGLGDALTAIIRYKWTTLFMMIAGGAVGFWLSKDLPSYYTATTALISDTGQARILDLETNASSYLVDPSATNTVVETIQTSAVLVRALDALPQETYDQLMQGGSIREQMLEITSDPANAETERTLLVKYMLENLEITNSGRSYVIYIGFRSLDPRTAATVANVVSEAYLNYRSQLRGQTYDLVIGDLQREVASLRLELQTAELLAQTAREERRVLMQRSEALSGPQLDSEIEASAKLYARQREAEREAEALAAIYETALRDQLRLQSNIAAPEINIQLFSRAVAPLEPSGMNMKPVIIALGVFIGFLFGASIGILRTRLKQK